MLVKTDIPKLLTAGMRKEFMKEFEKAPAEWEKIAIKIKSTKSEEDYAWIGGVPGLHEWRDERIPEALLEHNYAIKNLDWEGSIAVSKNAIDDEQYNQINLKVKQLANRAKRFWGKMVFRLLSQGNLSTGTATVFNGKNITCYDGNPFFYGSHEEGESGSQSNKGTVAFSLDAMQTAMEAMMALKDDKGEELEVRPNLLVVNPKNMFLAREILNSTYFPTQTATTTFKLASNVMKGIVDLYVSPFVDADDWFLFDTTGIIKPVILQVRKDIDFQSLLTGPEAFMRKKLYFGVDWRGMVGWGLWQYAYGSSSTW